MENFFPSVLIQAIGVATGAMAIGAALSKIFRQLSERTSAKERDRAAATYRSQLSVLAERLRSASAEADQVLREMERTAAQRQAAVETLENTLQALSTQEEDLQQRVNALEKVSAPAVEYFVDIIAQGEKRSASRDYLLFGAGVVVSGVLAVILNLVFGI